MRRVTISVTAADLEGRAWMPIDCPGYRATKRVVPSIVAHGFSGFTVPVQITISVPQFADDTLTEHARWQLTGGKSGKEAKPFSFEVAVPDDVETTEGI